ncbi:MAG: DUF922 domain-containing protein, partial [Maribacter sp.]|nr:DUF922 domain-containing protein [Maribacter sp.]
MGTLKYIICCIFFIVLGNIETQEYETIEWSPDYKLTWEDFKGKSPNNDRAAATTASGISYQFSTSALNGEIELDYEVNTFFYPQKS